MYIAYGCQRLSYYKLDLASRTAVNSWFGLTAKTRLVRVARVVIILHHVEYLRMDFAVLTK